MKKYINTATLQISRKMTLENILGNLRDAYKQVVPGTVSHSDQLMRERRVNRELRGFGFYTGDGPLYRVHGGVVQLGLTREPDNLVLRHIDDAFPQLVETGNYLPDPDEADATFAAGTTLVTDLSELGLSGSGEFGYFNVDTKKYDCLNPVERMLAERVYGQGDDFVANMEMLEGVAILSPAIIVLHPDYVKKAAKKRPIGRAGWLRPLCNYFDFGAGGRDIDYDGRLRGVRRPSSEASIIAPEGRDAEKNPFVAHYTAILNDPQSALAALNDKTAAGLSKLVTQYLLSRRQ